MTALHILSVKTRRLNAQRNIEIYLCSDCAVDARPGNIHHETGTALNERGNVLSLQRMTDFNHPHVSEEHCEACSRRHRFDKPTPEEAVEIKCQEIYDLFEEEMRNSRFSSSGMIQTLTQELARRMSAFVTGLRRNETPR